MMYDLAIRICRNSNILMIQVNRAGKMKTLMGNISILAVFLLMAMPLYAQQTGQQQHQMQQQMQQMQDMQQKMTRMMEHTQNMTREMHQRMEQAHNEQMREQYQMMHRFGENLGMTLGNMKNAAERCELMLRDREMMRDREMNQEMERMRRHLSDMTDEMEEAIRTMERMAERLRTRQQQ